MKKEKSIKKGKITSKSPSNIALIKYWGKNLGIQIPSNTSISYTLTKSCSKTKLVYTLKKKFEKKISLKLFFNKKENTIFNYKIKRFFEKIIPYCQYLFNYNFVIKTSNNFPHSSGIASSASSISSLTKCLIKFEKQLKYFVTNSNDNFFFLKRASFFSRIGSGSACRSIYSGLVIWGENKIIKKSSNLYAIPYPYEVHKIFKKYCDTILIIDKSPKKLSSSKGHNLMVNHIYAKQRFKIANENFKTLIYTLKIGDLEKFGNIIESEAMNLHAMILSSNPYYLLLKPNTINVIEKVLEFRKQTNNPLYFTLDAGANVHLLYPLIYQKIIIKFIKKKLSKFCYKKKIIEDFTYIR